MRNGIDFLVIIGACYEHGQDKNQPDGKRIDKKGASGRVVDCHSDKRPGEQSEKQKEQEDVKACLGFEINGFGHYGFSFLFVRIEV